MSEPDASLFILVCSCLQGLGLVAHLQLWACWWGVVSCVRQAAPPPTLPTRLLQALPLHLILLQLGPCKHAFFLVTKLWLQTCSVSVLKSYKVWMHHWWLDNLTTQT